MAQRPLCARGGCPNRVNRSSAKFCSPECAQKDAASAVATMATDTVDTQGDLQIITKTVDDEVKTLDDLIRVCHIDTSEWTVKRFLCGKWADNFQVKAWLERKVALIAAKDEIAQLIEHAKRTINRPLMVLPGKAKTSTSLLEIAMPDLHAGKLAWGKETGHANYNTQIAVQDFNTALEALVQRTSSHPISEVLFVVGNDLLNADNAALTTTRGTPQDSDSRYHKTFSIVRQMIVNAIERLKLIAPVKVLMVSGNHDTLAVWHLGDSLECYFHNDPAVTIDNAPKMRKYHQHGKVMLMFTHGDKGKHTNYPLTMATEEPKMFGNTVFREAHTGHLHKTKLDEFNGVRVRISPALTPPDAWHSEMCFTGQGRSAEAFVWDPNEGLIASAFYTVPL